MPVNRDFSDLFSAFNAARVRYLLVGGYAIAVHAEPRHTKDLDVWVDPTAENSARVFEALSAFGAPLRDVAPSDFQRPGLILQLGVPPNRIDVITGITGVSFPAAWEGRTETTYGGHAVPVIGLRDLIQNKRATGRPQDAIDADMLEKQD